MPRWRMRRVEDEWGRAMARFNRAASLVYAVLSLSIAGSAWAADVNTIATGCMNCHDKDGVSTAPSVPSIAGMSAAYIADEINDYKKKERPCPEAEVRSGDKKGTKTNMCEVVKDLSDTDVKAIAGFFAGKKFVPANQSFDAARAKIGQQLHSQNCEKCHSKNGSDPADDSGFLAGQWTPYLKEQLALFAAGKRIADPKMKPVIAKLDNDAFDALLNYYASLK
jgi:sulfide dehydrogenase cytochrome subunit